MDEIVITLVWTKLLNKRFNLVLINANFVHTGGLSRYDFVIPSKPKVEVAHWKYLKL